MLSTSPRYCRPKAGPLRKAAGTDGGECEQILRLEESAGVRLVQVGFMRRFDPGYVELHRRIAAGEVGTPVLAHCVHGDVDVPESWTSETTVVSAASHEMTSCLGFLVGISSG